MDKELRDQLLAKEVQYVEILLSHLQATPAWRLFATASLARDARSSLRKCAALIGYTGEWWRDVWLYLASALPLFLPLNLAFGAVLFASLVGVIASALTTVKTRTVVIEKTVEVPFLYFFSIKKTVSEEVSVPDLQPPHWLLSNGLACAVILIGLLLMASFFKYLWLYEVRYRRDRLIALWKRQT